MTEMTPREILDAIRGGLEKVARQFAKDKLDQAAPPQEARRTAERPRITLDPKALAGKPVIRQTRLSVEFVIGLMADGWSEVDILANYPGITHDDVIACLAYARDTLSSAKAFPSTV
jgi:uncharacterized protein (DUF433 family)